MDIVIVAGGKCDPEWLGGMIRDLYPKPGQKMPHLLGVDAGVFTLENAGLLPDEVLGDFDSVSEAEKERILRAYPKQKVLIPEKDDTDLEAAISLAISMKPGYVRIFGATGTRMDHVMAGLRLLSGLHAAGIPGEILDPTNRIRLISGTFTLKKDEQYGRYVSLLPYDRELRNVTLQGMKYPLKDARLPFDQSLGVSNEVTEDTAVISLGEGRAYLMETRD